MDTQQYILRPGRGLHLGTTTLICAACSHPVITTEGSCRSTKGPDCVIGFPMNASEVMKLSTQHHWATHGSDVVLDAGATRVGV